VAFGFVQQCRNLSPHAKVLASSFSNAGADNLAEAMLKLGLKIVRIGKPSAVAEGLWDYTLEAAITRDVTAQQALADAARATSALSSSNKRYQKHNDSIRSFKRNALQDAATAAVKKAMKVNYLM
jgi:hypothetical protein